MNKKNIRQEMLEKRKNISEEVRRNLSEQIAENIINSHFYKNFQHICIYQAFRGEVLCDRKKKQAFGDGKQVYVPVTNQEQKLITFYEIHEDTAYQTGAYGIMEPVMDEQSTVLSKPALILMPGLAFDRNKHRIGYGGGYYDRYLAVHPEHAAVALCFGFQVIDTDLPCEEHDILPGYIVTEQEIF